LQLEEPGAEIGGGFDICRSGTILHQDVVDVIENRHGCRLVVLSSLDQRGLDRTEDELGAGMCVI
jgi:hypothetical protein